MSLEKKSLKQIIDYRKDKLNSLRKNGINPCILVKQSRSILNNLKEKRL